MRSMISMAVLCTVLIAASPASAAGAAPQSGHGASRLADPHPCAGQAAFTCATLTVPLDHSGHASGALDLQVAMASNSNAPKGVLLFLTGGPGQPGVPFMTRISQRMPQLMQDYQLVMLDQRGTGEFGSIKCPALQAATGSSDVAAPPAGAARECAALLGNSRRFYGTADTVADLDQLRRALGVQRMTLDGVSYGVFVAARYAVAHPRQVNKLVLDSVLPHVDPQADDAFYLAALHSTSRVLRAACAALTGCDFDPADDIAYLVRTRTDSVALLDLVIGWEFVDPNYGDVIFAAHKARQGQPADLDALIAGLAEFNAAPYESFSSGLHAATLCADERLPWGDASAPEAGRQAALDRAVRKLRQRDVWPWSPATAAGQGFIQNCLFWPQTQVRPEPPTHATRLPAVPTLIVNGDHDLVTPLEWAFEEARYAPMVKVVVVAGASHSIQNRERGTAGRQAVIDFLLNS